MGRNIYLRAFSLIELMVVIAIVALLAAVAVPAYSIYSTKAKIVPYLSILSDISSNQEQVYNLTGSFPDDIIFNNTTLVWYAWRGVYYKQMYSMVYNVSPDRKGISIGLVLSGLGNSDIPGYVEPASPDDISSSLFFYATRDVDGIMRHACGWYVNYGIDATASMPLQYLPDSCQCQNIKDFYISYTGSCV